MGWFILACLIVALLILLARWFVEADVRALAGRLRWVLFGVGALIVALLLFSGRLGFLWAALPFLIPVLMRLAMWRKLGKAARGPSGGQRSSVTTRFVEMQLDHDTGQMDGTVREGPHAGERLSALSREALLDLLSRAHDEDAQSANVLEAYLDRMQPDWREAASAAGNGREERRQENAGPRGSRMTRDQAFEVLGLKPGAGEDEIKAAHRRLMQQYHPDRGGSDFLAAQINEAKDLLLDG